MKTLTLLSLNIFLWAASLYLVEKLVSLLVWYGGIDKFWSTLKLVLGY